MNLTGIKTVVFGPFLFPIQSGAEWIDLCSKSIIAEDIESHLIFEDETVLGCKPG